MAVAATANAHASTRDALMCRLDTIIDCDKIIVMHKGKAEEVGTPHELLQAQGSAFASLVAQTGSTTAARLRRLALQAHESRAATRGKQTAKV